MARRPTARFEAGLTVLALALTLAGCSTQESPAKVNAKVIEVEVAQQLLAEGAVAATPTIDCGEDLVTLVEGGEVDCTMAVEGDTDTAAVTVTISDVNGHHLQARHQTGGQPRVVGSREDPRAASAGVPGMVAPRGRTLAQ